MSVAQLKRQQAKNATLESSDCVRFIADGKMTGMESIDSEPTDLERIADAEMLRRQAIATFDAETASVLAYASPHVDRRTDLRSTLTRLIDFAIARPRHTVAIWIATWSVLSGLWAVVALMRANVYDRQLIERGLAMLLDLDLLVFVALLVLLTCQKLWKLAGLCVLLAVHVSIACGTVQTNQCPHARYLQIGTAVFAIRGTACGNVQHLEPWWMRE